MLLGREEPMFTEAVYNYIRENNHLIDKSDNHIKLLIYGDMVCTLTLEDYDDLLESLGNDYYEDRFSYVDVWEYLDEVFEEYTEDMFIDGLIGDFVDKYGSEV